MELWRCNNCNGIVLLAKEDRRTWSDYKANMYGEIEYKIDEDSIDIDEYFHYCTLCGNTAESFTDEADSLSCVKEIAKWIDEIVEFSEIGNYSPMSLHTFANNVKDGGFNDYDGYGYLSYENRTSNINIKPSNYDKILKIYEDMNFTHIMWYDK